MLLTKINNVCVSAPALHQVILSTNIAETSITIAGVRYVIDTGFVKSRSYSPRLGADCLQVGGKCWREYESVAAPTHHTGHACQLAWQEIAG